MSKTSYRNKGSKDNIIISLAGAHGVGKSTIYNILKKKFEGNTKFKFFPERYKKIPPFSFGSKDKQIAFRSEIHFLAQLSRRNTNITNYDDKYNGRILILDRTPLCVLIYSKALNLKEKDYGLILEQFNSIEWREDYIIYLTAKPETILKRIIQRGSLEEIRKEWNETEEKYLHTILSYYNQFLFSKDNKDRVFTIDTDKLTPEEVVEEIKGIISELSGYSFEKIEQPPKKLIRTSQMNLVDFLKRN